MQTISINFIVPQGWHELGDKQLRYVYQILAFDCSCQRGQRSNLFEPMPSAADKSIWQKYLELRSQIIDLEASLAEEWLSPELMSALLAKNLRSERKMATRRSF